MIKTIDLLRHGSVDGQPALYGCTDVGLSQFGLQQVVSQTGRLGIVTEIVT